ncbi:hypothetical protein, partial [Winogradskyella sp.]
AGFYGYFEIINDMIYNLYLIPTKKIKKLIKSKKYHRQLKGGDRKASRFFLFDKNLFKDDLTK